MPLSYSEKNARKISISQKVGNLLLRFLALVRPETILAIFLIVAILLAFLQITAVGFYIVFSIFVVGYFAERIVLKLKIKK